ncbi:MAG: isopeptide-forming domain-containing fimbrial protein [Atopobiaceae bacterium]|nr:isopeptide-forming domain-containing fimbrial protein [Atopobiaceae bacterium]
MKKGSGFWLRNKSLARFMSVLVSVSMILSLLPAQGVQEARSEFLMATAVAQEDPKTNETTDPGGSNTNNSSSSSTNSSSTNEGGTPSESKPESDPEPSNEPANEPKNEAPANNANNRENNSEQKEPEQSSSSSSSSETKEPEKTPQGADLADFITKAEVEGAEEKDGVLQVKEGQTYTAKLTFTENNEKQFATEGELTYKLPAGFTPAAEQPAAKEALYITYVDDNGERQPIELGKESRWVDGDTVHVVWKVRDADKRSPEEVAQALATINELTSVEFELSIVGTFAAGTKSVDFGAPTEPIAIEVEAAKKDEEQKKDEEKKDEEQDANKKSDEQNADKKSEEQKKSEEEDAKKAEELAASLATSMVKGNKGQSVVTAQSVWEKGLAAAQALTAQSTTVTDLSQVVKSVSITAPQNESGACKLMPGETYSITMSFAENSNYQFPDDATHMTYTVPNDFKLPTTGEKDFKIIVTDPNGGQHTVSGNKYKINDNNQLEVWFNTSDSNFDYLKGSPNVRFNMSFDGEFDSSKNKIEFPVGVDIDVELDNTSEVDANKSAKVADGETDPSWVLENIPVGDYTVTETNNPKKYDLTSEYKVGENRTINDKATLKVESEKTLAVDITNNTPDKPGFDKKIKDTNDTTGETSDWQDSADYDIGDAVPYKLTATLPKDVTAYKKYHITFTDKMEKSLTYNKDAKITVTGSDGKVIPESEYEATKVAENEHDFGYTLTWTGKDQSYIANEALNGAKVEVEFTATLNSDAVLGKEGNVNACKLAYSNNPTSKDDKEEGELDWDYVIAFTYKVDVSKVDENSRPLKGAEFKLEKELADGTTKEIEITASESSLFNRGNVFTATGLDDGTYILTETTAPEGYNKIDPIEFTVSAEHREEWQYNSNPESDPVFDNDGTGQSKRLGNLTSLTGDEETGTIELKADDKLEGLSGDVVNSKNGANIVVKKKVSSSRSDDKKRDFKFKVTLYKDKEYKEVYKSINGTYGDMKFKDGVANFTLKHDESKEASKLPITKDGIYYKVEETDSGDLTPNVSNPRKSLDGYTHTVTCTNTYKSSTPRKSSTSSRLATARTGDNTNNTIVIALVGIGVIGVIAGVLSKRRRASK